MASGLKKSQTNKIHVHTRIILKIHATVNLSLLGFSSKPFTSRLGLNGIVSTRQHASLVREDMNVQLITSRVVARNISLDQMTPNKE